MKKGLLILGTSSLFFVWGNFVEANETNYLETKGEVLFKPGGGQSDNKGTYPNPDPNKDKYPDPIIKQVVLSNGPLRFTNLPDINFGEAELSAQKTNYYYAEYLKQPYSENDKDKMGEYPTFLTLEDLRGGVKGWKVTLQHNGIFTNTLNSKEKLKGFIQLSNPSIVSGTFVNEGDIERYSPTTSLAVSSYTTVSNEEEQEIEILSAFGEGNDSTGQGYGEWSFGFGDTSKKTTGFGANGDEPIVKGKQPNNSKKGRNLGVRLEFPAQVAQTDTNKNQYETTLYWGLQDAK